MYIDQNPNTLQRQYRINRIVSLLRMFPYRLSTEYQLWLHRKAMQIEITRNGDDALQMYLEAKELIVKYPQS